MKAVGVISMLHEPAADNSATRPFRTQPVLWWALARLAAVQGVDGWTVLCWGDQAEAVAACVGASGVKVVSKGDRKEPAAMQGVTAAARWLDGWRGGLLQTCDFDRGFHAGWMAEVMNEQGGDAVVIVDPSSGLVDPGLLTETIAHADVHADEGMVFTPAAPGLNGIVVRKVLLERLAQAGQHPGRLLAYLQDQPGKDPIARDCCAPVPTPVARTVRRFKLDTVRQVRRLAREMEALNGQLVRTGAEELVRRAESDLAVDDLPREVVLELNTERSTRPIWWPGRYEKIDRPAMSVETAERLFAGLAEMPDTRLTLAGVGDPLLHPELREIVAAARSAGLHAIHVETDLLGVGEERVAALASMGVDIVSFHVPAVTQETYAKVMGVDGYLEVLENLKRLVSHRHAAGRGVPLIVPTFVKCRDNLAEMEAWYDQWLRVLGSAVINGPTSRGGVVPDDVGVAAMEPPKRRPCARLWNRLTVLCDGRIAKCEEDALGREIIGQVGNVSMKEVWTESLEQLRQRHRAAQWDQCGSCGGCREWHRS
jgi:radical SAM protein with 4Fe4S-binding SPASM domain